MLDYGPYWVYYKLKKRLGQIDYLLATVGYILSLIRNGTIGGSNVNITTGTVPPNGVVTGSPPDMYIQDDGTVFTDWRKRTGTNTNTGWVEVVRWIGLLMLTTLSLFAASRDPHIGPESDYTQGLKILTNSAAWRTALATSPDTYYMNWVGTNTTMSSANVQTMLDLAAGKRLIFPPGLKYELTSSIYPKSGTHLIGHGAIITNASPATSGLMLVQITNQQNVVIEGLTFDCGPTSHHNNGNVWVRGSTNVTLRDCTFKYGGYLANVVIASLGGAVSENVNVYNCRILDQRYGSAATSTASFSVAEGSKNCVIHGCYLDYPTVGTLGLSYNPLSGSDPKAPSLVMSIDGSYNTRVTDCTFRNTSGMTNLVGIIFEDNGGRTNQHHIVANNIIDGYESATKAVLLDGRIIYDNCILANSSKWAYDTGQTELAGVHNVRSVVFNNCKFINNYSTPRMGTNNLGYYYNEGGQIRYVANPPYRLILNNCDFITYSTNSEFSHLLYGAGDLTVRDCFFQNGAYGIRATDPAIMIDPVTPNGLYNADPLHRKVTFFSNNRFDNVTNCFYGISDARGGDNWVDGNTKFSVRDEFYKQVTTNTTTRLFSIKTVPTSRNDVGVCGGYTAVVTVTLCNDSPTSSHQSGSVGVRSASFSFTQAINHDSPPTVNTTPVQGLWSSPLAQVGARGYDNITVTTSNSSYYTTDVNIYFTGMDDVSSAYVTYHVTVYHTGMYVPPTIVR